MLAPLLLNLASSAPAPTPAPTAAPVAGGYDDDEKRKPRFVIEVDGRTVEFRSERAAKAALKAQDKPAQRIETVAIQPAPKPVKAKAAVVEPEYDDEEDIELLLMAL